MKIKPKHLIIGGSGVLLLGAFLEVMERMKREIEAEHLEMVEENDDPRTIDAEFEIIETPILKLPKHETDERIVF